jgi:hypothetical protein
MKLNKTTTVLTVFYWHTVWDNWAKNNIILLKFKSGGKRYEPRRDAANLTKLNKTIIVNI